MYVLDYLAGRLGDIGSISEYRLLCSGEVYNGKVLTAEHWRKSEPSRYIVMRPCLVVVVSRPFDDYPQELFLRISVGEVSETSEVILEGRKFGNFSSQFRPDDEIARDVAALLTVFLRRLVTVFAKVRVMDRGAASSVLPGSEDLALPIANSMTRVAWKKRAVLFEYGVNGLKNVIDYNPPPLEVDPNVVETRLNSLSKAENGNAYVLTSRVRIGICRTAAWAPTRKSASTPARVPTRFLGFL